MAFHSALRTLLVGLAALSVSHLCAQIADVTWVGGGGNGSVVNTPNWSALPNGNGGNLIFGTATNTAVTIDAAELIAAFDSSTLTVDDIKFTATTNYTFSGTGSPTLKLQGSLITQAANTVSFGSGLNLVLPSGVQSIDVASGGQVSVSSPVSGAGSIEKTGLGKLLISGPATYTGGTSVRGGTLQVNFGGSIAHNGADLTVTQSGGAAQLEVAAGGSVSSQNTRLGVATGETGQASLSGAGASLTSGAWLYVGEGGTGTMNVNGGAAVSSVGTSIGHNSGSTGYLSVSGSGTALANSDTLIVGRAGVGSLALINGATATNVHGIVGDENGGSGSVIVADPNSVWNNTTDLVVGDAGLGTLGIFDGGKVTVNGGAGTVMLGAGVTGDGALLIGDTGRSAGILNAAAVTTGAGSGDLVFFTTGSGTTPYYFTKDGTAAGTAVNINGATNVSFLGGYNVLSGNNNYTGTTTIAAGTVVADGVNYSHQLGTGSVTVASTGTLMLKGTTLHNSAVTVHSGARLAGVGAVGSGGGTATSLHSGGVLAPGLTGLSAVGELRFDDLTLHGGSILEWNLSNPNGEFGTGWDFISIEDYSATLHIDDSAETTPISLKLISLDATGNPGIATGFLNQTYTWEILSGGPVAIDFAGSGTFNPAAFSIDSSQFSTDIGAGTFSLLHNSSTHTLALQFTPVPEPSTYALLALGAGSLGLRFWRRRRT